MRGGRYNPSDSFDTLYLCRTRACAGAELRRQAEAQAISLEALLPRALYRYRIEVDGVVDLTDDTVLELLKVTSDDLVGRSWHLTQEIGAVAHHLGCAGLLVPSATGVDSVLVVFVGNVGLGVVEPSLAERWSVPDQIP